MVEINKVLKNTVKKGEVKIGVRETKIAVDKEKAKLVILSKNCPFSSEIKQLAKKKKIPIYTSNSNSIDLGYICGKAYAVSIFAVLDDGGSNIMHFVKKR